MMRTITALGFLLVSGLAAAVDVNTPSGKVSVQLPADFTALTRQEVQAKFGRNGQLPVAVYGNRQGTATVAFTWTRADQGPLGPNELPQIKSQLVDGMNGQLQGMRWLKKEIRSINGKSWIYLENISQARDSKIHNRIYGADLNGNLLMINLNATEAEFGAYATAFATAEKSLVAK